MSIVAMKKLRLIAVQSQQKDILRELMLLGCVQVTDPGETSAEGLRRAEHGEAYRRRNQQSTVLSALKQLSRVVPNKRGLLSPAPEISTEALLDESRLEENLACAEHILSLDVKIRSITAQESRERATIEAMKPWLGMNLPLECKGTETCSLILGTIPASTTAENANTALAEQEASMTEVFADSSNRWVTVIFTKDHQDAAGLVLRTLGFNQISMVGMSGTPRENADASAARLQELAAEKAAVEAEIAALAPRREQLEQTADTLGTMIAREETAERLLKSESTFCFEGWLTAPEEEKLAQVLAKYDCAWDTRDPDPEHPEEVPIKLQNNALTQPYNLVTEMYSLPAYNGLDPNPFIMPFFALFFGIMFADMAYGLILLAGGLLVKFKARPKKGGMKNIAGLLIECGISTFIMGFLTGGLFGDAITIIGQWFGKDWAAVPYLGTLHFGAVTIDLPLSLLEGNNPLYVLIGAIALGAVHLAVGVGIGMYFKIKEGQWVDAILNDLCWWVMLIGLGLMALGNGTVVLWVGVGMMVLGAVLGGKGFGRITGIFSAVYNGATGYLGDFLSYSRLMALMLAGSVIASVFNQLGSLGNANGFTVMGTLVFVIVFCIGHALNFGLNIIGCFVHTLRLQYLEFFGKWYRDGGKAFKPLTVNTKFYDMKDEKEN